MYSELTHLWVQQLLWSVVETSPSWGVASICPFKLHVLLLMFLDLHLQISWTQTIYLRSHFFVQFFWYNFFVLFLSKTTKLNLLVSLHEKVCIDFNFIYYLLLSLSLSFFLSFFSLSKGFPLNANLWAFLFLFLDFGSIKLGKLVSLFYCPVLILFCQ